jgi:hypothetical protein
MTMRMLLVAVSTAAILAGSSYGALADHSASVSKGSSQSDVFVIATTKDRSPIVILSADGSASATAPNGGGAGASYSAGGGGSVSSGEHGSTSAGGGVSGSACAGSGCGGHH